MISTDPVAIDAASIALVEQKTGKKISELAYNIPYFDQIEYSKKIGFGSAEFTIIECNDQ